MAIQTQLVKNEVTECILGNPEISMKHSVDFMKKLTVFAISSISYLRDIFPEFAFSDRNVEGLKIKLLKATDDIPGTQTMIHWIRSALDAVDLNLLKKLMLIIQEMNSQEAVEIYSFNFIYHHEAVSCQLINESDGHAVKSMKLPSNIKQSVQLLLRMVLALTTNLRPLPDCCQLSMKLEYHDSVNDVYKIPEVFRICDPSVINFPPGAKTMELGKVETTFTTFALSLKSVLMLESKDSEDEDEGVMQTSTPASQLSVPFTSLAVDTIQSAPEQGVGTTNLSETLSSINLREVKCICECVDDSSDNVKCASCCTYQHRACYKLLDNQQVARHICVNCHDPENSSKTCTVPDFLSDNNRKAKALYRRALLLCLSTLRVSVNTFATHLNVPRQSAQHIFNRLGMDGCFSPTTTKSNMRCVKTDHLRKNILHLYFAIPSNNNSETLMETEETPLLSEIIEGNAMRRKNTTIQDKENSSVVQRNEMSPIVQQKKMSPIVQRKRPRYSTIGQNIKVSRLR